MCDEDILVAIATIPVALCSMLVVDKYCRCGVSVRLQHLIALFMDDLLKQAFITQGTA